MLPIDRGPGPASFPRPERSARQEQAQELQRLAAQERSSEAFRTMQEAIEHASSAFQQASRSPDFWKQLSSSSIHRAAYPDLIKKLGQERADAIQFYLEESELEAQNGRALVARTEQRKRRLFVQHAQEHKDIKATQPMPNPDYNIGLEDTIDATPVELDDTLSGYDPGTDRTEALTHIPADLQQQASNRSSILSEYEAIYNELMQLSTQTDPEHTHNALHAAFEQFSRDQQLILKYVEYSRRRALSAPAVRKPSRTPARPGTQATQLPFFPLPLVRTEPEPLIEQRLRDRLKEKIAETRQGAQTTKATSTPIESRPPTEPSAASVAKEKNAPSAWIRAQQEAARAHPARADAARKKRAEPTPDSDTTTPESYPPSMADDHNPTDSHQGRPLPSQRKAS